MKVRVLPYSEAFTFSDQLSFVALLGGLFSPAFYSLEFVPVTHLNKWQKRDLNWDVWITYLAVFSPLCRNHSTFGAVSTGASGTRHG